MPPRRRTDLWQPLPPAIDDQPGSAAASAGGGRRVVRGTVDDLAAAVSELDPDAGGLTGTTVESIVLAGARVLGGRVTGLRLRDVVADQAVLAGIVLDGGGATRVRVTGGRVSGTVWIRGELNDVVFDQVRADGLALRACLLRRARFVNCDLSGLDMTDTRLDHVRFEDCDLSSAIFTGTQIAAAQLRGCRFDGVVGADGLAGAEVDSSDLASLAGPMAAALGISVV
ncbi:pentapeptide repeat-containing protein [Frankia sp. Mgl5]|uniref:pentapeptide repeat-containing protein n=1 Tax=Frankiaceae TaxID=74712 RepID=UPI000A725314|nr:MULTISPECIES: pentapeptide repeat-containing protein [Frankiaceae]MCK9925614.1 pentapeptide repeat-containing protein [Frankia sp. Mgl5]